ncbi:MAG TPA: LytR C-terminal domain-containing protein [Gemmatimonadaceae bacterium]|jgi:hypothetical protein
MKRLTYLGVVALLLVVLGASAYVLRVRDGTRRPLVAALPPSLGGASAPSGVRVRVQVLNTTGKRGLARRAMHLLRDRGFDVVEIGTSGPPQDTTLVLDRSRHPDWASAVARILAPARAEARPDSSRYLDVTVLLGRTWRPPAEPLDP